MNKEITEYSPRLKDMLCRTYKFIERFKDEKTYVDFTISGVMKVGDVNEKYATKFLKLLPEIKQLVEEQPHHIYVCHSMIKFDEERTVGKFEHRIVESYDTRESDWNGLTLFGRDWGTRKKVGIKVKGKYITVGDN